MHPKRSDPRHKPDKDAKVHPAVITPPRVGEFAKVHFLMKDKGVSASRARRLNPPAFRHPLVEAFQGYGQTACVNSPAGVPAAERRSQGYLPEGRAAFFCEILTHG